MFVFISSQDLLNEPQYLQYVRERNGSDSRFKQGRLKGQLWHGWRTRNSTRKTIPKQRIWDERITLNNPPIPGKRSLAKEAPPAGEKPVEYSTASWRRAVLSLDEHYKAWLLWNYGENTWGTPGRNNTRWAWCGSDGSACRGGEDGCRDGGTAEETYLALQRRMSNLN
ncbi:hypothetical protein KCP74_15255 [Salmonella enterica subsp. enterica]|nr:hypothetical protein KCP74_15255 [Salmonella enterica subsp. enterica]